jgi:hypothetical protein
VPLKGGAITTHDNQDAEASAIWLENNWFPQIIGFAIFFNVKYMVTHIFSYHIPIG